MALYGVTFLHLDADFPYFSPWDDWAKTTDEGWYTGGALHHFIFGHWHLPHAFNAAVALPVWSLMQGVWFFIFGVGMVQARSLAVLLYGLSLLLLYLLLRRAACSRLASAFAVLLMVSNPFCYVFDRMAILEPVMVFWWLVSLWVANRAARGRVRWAILLGFLVLLLLLTKTTAVLLGISSILYVYAYARQQGLPWAKPVMTAIATTSVLWCIYFFGWVRPFYLSDYRFLFALNSSRVHLPMLAQETLALLSGGLWISKILFPLGVLALMAATVWMRKLWRSPLFVAAVASLVLYMVFILYHSYFQPRYYLVIAMPMLIVSVMLMDQVVRNIRKKWVMIAGVGVAVLIAGLMTSQTLKYVLHPGYAYRDTAREIASVMRADPSGVNHVLWAGAGDDISLFTGVQSVSTLYPDGLDAMTERYHPEWLLLVLDWQNKEAVEIAQRYKLQRVRSFSVYNDLEFHRELVLYRITPQTGSGLASK